MLSTASEPRLAARPAGQRQRVVRVSVWQADDGATALVVRNERDGERNYYADVNRYYDITPASLMRLSLAVWHLQHIRPVCPRINGRLGWEVDY